MKKKKELSKKKNNKINPLLIPIIIIIILIIGFKLLPTQKKENKTNLSKETTTIEKHNTNEKVIEDKTINNIKFTDIDCVYDGNYSIITYKIINTGNTTVNLSEYELIVKDKEGNIITNILPDIDKNLQPNEEYETGNTINMDLSKAYSIEIQIDNTN